MDWSERLRLAGEMIQRRAKLDELRRIRLVYGPRPKRIRVED
jgi:hypothetical protein